MSSCKKCQKKLRISHQKPWWENLFSELWDNKIIFLKFLNIVPRYYSKSFISLNRVWHGDAKLVIITFPNTVFDVGDFMRFPKLPSALRESNRGTSSVKNMMSSWSKPCLLFRSSARLRIFFLVYVHSTAFSSASVMARRFLVNGF